MNRPRPTWLLVNPASGSNSDDALAELQAAMADAGRPIQRVIAIPDEPAPDRETLEQAGVGMLAVFTGDGTANRVLTSLYGWGGDLLVLPGGTQNLLARSLHGEATAAEIVALLKQDGLRRVSRPRIGCSAGDALCEIVAGPGAAWSDVRESIRDLDIPEIASSLGEAIEKSAVGPMVALSDPPLGKPEGYTAVRIYPADDDHALLVDGYGADTIADYAKAGLALLRRDFREGPHEKLGRHTAVTCLSEQPIELMLDGERAIGNPEEHFEVGPCNLTFLAASAVHG